MERVYFEADGYDYVVGSREDVIDVVKDWVMGELDAWFENDGHLHNRHNDTFDYCDPYHLDLAMDCIRLMEEIANKVYDCESVVLKTKGDDYANSTIMVATER